MRKLREMTKNIWFGVKTCFLASKLYFFLKCLVLLSTTLIPLMNIWLWKEVLNGIMIRAFETVLCCLVEYLALKLLIYLLSQFDNYVNKRYQDELQFYIDGVMIEKTSRMDLAFFDSAQMADKVQHARNNFNVMTEITWLVFDIISEVVNIIATLIIVCTYKWWIGIFTLILLVPYLVYNKKYTEKRLYMEEAQLRDNRKMEYYSGVLYDNNVQFEIKLNGIGEYFITRWNEVWKKLYQINRREDVRHSAASMMIEILNVLSDFLMLTISVLDIIKNQIGIGDLQYNLNMVIRLREQTTSLMRDIDRFLINNTRLNELQEFMEIKPEIEKSGTRLPSSNPRVEFQGVTFQYPNAKEYVLKNCSFTIEPHEKVGLIGLNGAGKSTIIKLLFRFYDPEEGVILLDGVDLKEYDVYAVRKVFGVLFQDYVTYCLPLREIIALSDFDERFNDQKLKKACDISGLMEVIKDWEQGFDSVLGRYYADNGKDFSGGQWQLVGLARAYFKDSEYMILDEPSAALDPISEDRIFEQLYHV